MSRARSTPSLLGLALLALTRPHAAAQQYSTDDATITECRACQIQMWHGQRSSWLLPVCTIGRDLEPSLGFVAVWKDGADGHFEYTAQVKTLARPLTTDSWGAGLAVGILRDPGFTSTGTQAYAVYAYIPVSRSLACDRVVLHQNTGWLFQIRQGEGRHAFLWGGAPMCGSPAGSAAGWWSSPRCPAWKGSGQRARAHPTSIRWGCAPDLAPIVCRWT